MLLLLDIQMPRMNGITFLKKLMAQHPIPVIIVSSIAQKDSRAALLSYKYGAIDVIEKPHLSSDILMEKWKRKFLTAITTAASSDVSKIQLHNNYNEPAKN